MTEQAAYRSILAVPASSMRFMEKAAQGPADSIFLDLEDAVIPSLKPKARQDAITAINQLDWGKRGVAVRVNGFGTAWGCRDIIEVAEACPRLDYILLPKCESAADVHAVQMMIDGAEAAAPRDRKISIMGLIETPRGVANVESIAQAGGRLRALVFGGGDYQLDLGSFQRAVGAPAADYVVLSDADGSGARERHWNDLWHFATARIANACRAFGVMPIDGPFSGIPDTDGLRAAAKRARVLGFECKMAIHPSQIDIIHEVMTPSAAQLAWAKEVLEAMEAAAREGRGAVKDKNGEMIDLMHIKVANKLLERAAKTRRQDMTALKGIRVLDLGTFIAGPHCATILGEFGAEVIKVEPPKTGDSLRRLGTTTECGDTLVWLSEARNKKCVTLNLATERGREVLRQLAAKCDIIVENFRPGTIEKWGLGYEELKKLNPGIILVRISAYGQDGPMRTQPGFARIAHAFSGLTYLAGLPGGVPVVPGSTSLADYMSGMYGAIGALVALQARQTTGEGQCIDLALYESVFRVLDEIAPAYQKFGYVRERMGADTVNVCPHSHYQTKDGKWIAIACTSDAMFVRLAEVMEQPELAGADRYGPQALRLAARDEVNAIVAKWVATLDLETVLARCAKGGVPSSLIFSIADIFEDPQYRARGNIQTKESRAGPLAVPDVVPRLSSTPGEIRWLGEGIGAQNEEIFRDLLGIQDGDLKQMRDDGVI